MKLKSRINYLYTVLILLALFLAAAISLTLYYQLTPWQLELMERRDANYSSPYSFRDLNHDGFSELYKVSNSSDGEAHYIAFYNHQGAILDQLNANEPINPDWVFFGDYSGDGYEECFVFTVKADSLFLYAFDIVKKESPLYRHFLIPIPDPHPHFFITDAALYDLNNNYSKELLFLVHAGLASAPRGLYAFDLKKKQIINRFENHATKEKLLISDLTGNGRDEVIVIGKANGNGSKKVPFTDWKNWVFFLDQNLDTLVTPLSYGGYPSVSKVFPVQIKNERYLLIAHYRAAQEHQRRQLGLYLVSSQVLFARQRYFEIENMEGINLSMDNPENPQHIFISTVSNQLLRFDADFNLTKQKTTSFNSLRIRTFTDLNLDGKGELLTESSYGTQIFDQNFNLLAETEVPGRISLRQRGGSLAPEIGISAKDSFYHYNIIKNPLYAWLPLIFIAVFIAFLALQIGAHKIFTYFNIYLSYFKHSLQRTPNGIMLLTKNGKVFYFNNKIQNLLHLTQYISRKAHYKEVLHERPQIIQYLEQTLKSNESVHQDITFSSGQAEFKGKLSVIPFITKFGYVYAYLVEILDYTVPVLSDRHKTWSNTVRKMAHDIKTPLGSVLLNIERIQQKLQDTAPAALENTVSDFNMTLSEIRRIQEMTRQFLKFTRLEAPNTQPAHFKEILENTLSHFKAYLNDSLQIELNLEQEAHTIPADPKQLEMALQVFIENAIDALKGKGKILISTVLAQNLEQNFKDELEIEIADNGPGIPVELQDQIFEPFCTTKKDGTGMGLAIAKKIIHDHGGEVELISKENYGAVFRITFPAQSASTDDKRNQTRLTG